MTSDSTDDAASTIDETAVTSAYREAVRRALADYRVTFGP